jgi:phage terminase large subunit
LIRKKDISKRTPVSKGLTTTQLTRIFKKIAGDKLIVADSAEGRLIEEIKTEGLNIRKCKKGAGSVKDGIALMKDYQLIVDYKSLNLVEELNNYSWKKTVKNLLIDTNIYDAARYIITDRLKEQSGVYYIY